MEVSVEEPTACGNPSLTKLDTVVASDEIDGLTVNLPPPAVISPADTDTIAIENYIPPPEDFQNPRALVDTTIIITPAENNSETTDSNETDSDICCLTILKTKKDSLPYQQSKYPGSSVAVVEQPYLQVPSPTSSAEARREKFRRSRIQHYIETHGGLELSLDHDPSSGSRFPALNTKEIAPPSPNNIIAFEQLENETGLNRRTLSVPILASHLTQQATCSCMQPMLTLQRGSSMRPSEPNNAQLTPVHRKYIIHDPNHCETCFAMAMRNPRAETRLCVELTNYPIYSSATLTYSTVIYICNKYDGYQSLFVAPYQQHTLYAEYSTVQYARATVAGLNGFRLTEGGHVFRAQLVPLPYNAQRVMLAAHF